MKKYLFFAAFAVVALASCSDEDLAGPSSANKNGMNGESPIIFSSLNKGITRSNFTGKDAAIKLGNQFVVSAKKGNTTASTTSAVTFDNYVVEYAENTAHTTESNVANWEYVGKGRIKHAIDHGITSQTVKFWDYSMPQYDFIAWSTGLKTAIYEGTPGDGQVLVSALNPNATSSGTVTFEGKAADLSQIYISDLTTVKKAQYGDDPVIMTFRSLGTKVRIGIYETIPGYSVRNVKFYTTGGLLTKSGGVLDPGQIVDDATIFSTGADIYTEGTYTVTYPTVDNTSSADNNQAHVSFAPKSGVAQTTKVSWGGLNYTIAEEGEKTAGNVYLGRSSSAASFAGNADNNYYVTYLPNETGTNLNLRVDFTLEAIDGGGETIEVKNAKAQVPSIYTQWKPGFAYTYLFKISDKTNGRTGVYDPTQADDATVNSDPAGLYPITFDAVVVNEEDNDATQETITTIATPSITTYQQKSTVVNADEYTENNKDIFVTVNEGDALVTLTGKAALYIIDAGKTEAEVVDALQMQDDNAATGTIKGRSGLVLTQATAVADVSNIDGGNKYALTNSVQFGADGNAIPVATDQALRFRPVASTTYAFVYTKTASTTTTDYFEPITKSLYDPVVGYYRYAYAAAPYSYHHVDDNGTPGDASDDITTEYFDAQKGVKYFSYLIPNYSLETAFIGQRVNNLYLDAAGNTIASGYAKSHVTYYYTTDHGLHYTAAHNVNYADFGGSLFVEGTTPGTYVANTDATPQDGTAYYYYDTVNNKYIYCVILPQQVNGWFIQDTTADKVACGATESAIVGQTYFDKYVKNDGEYYTKVIKVQ